MTKQERMKAMIFNKSIYKMKWTKTSLFLGCLLMMPLLSIAQERPGWIYNKPTPSNSTYMYIMESASGKTELDARNQAIARVFQSNILRFGQKVTTSEINAAVQQGRSFEDIAILHQIPINKVCEYVEDQGGTYRVYLLCQVARMADGKAPLFDDFGGCYSLKKYNNAGALVASMFIPGLGQMIKRRGGEGALFLCSELALVGGGVTSYYLAKKSLNIIKAGNATYGVYTTESAHYNTYRIMNYTFYGAALVLHAVNMYRAYVVQPKYKQTMFSLTPTVLPMDNTNMAIGMSVDLKF